MDKFQSIYTNLPSVFNWDITEQVVYPLISLQLIYQLTLFWCNRIVAAELFKVEFVFVKVFGVL